MGVLDMTSETGFGATWAPEAVMEFGLALAAAAFTVVIWLASGSAPAEPQDAASQTVLWPDANRHITFPTVHVVASGKR